MNFLKRKKGFTMVEILVVLVIISIMSAAIVPTMAGFEDKYRKDSCVLQRETYLKLYKEHSKEDASCTLQGTLNGMCVEMNDMTKDFKCPSGGVFSADGDSISCSKHGKLK